MDNQSLLAFLGGDLSLSAVFLLEGVAVEVPLAKNTF